MRCNCHRLTREAQGVAGICSLGAAGNAFAGSRGQQTVSPPPKEMSSIACPTHWTRVHNASTSRKWCDGVKCALALDGRGLPGGRLGSEKSTMYSSHMEVTLKHPPPPPGVPPSGSEVWPVRPGGGYVDPPPARRSAAGRRRPPPRSAHLKSYSRASTRWRPVSTFRIDDLTLCFTFQEARRDGTQPPTAKELRLRKRGW